ncbi:MAG: hypothetical protein NVS3B1_17780 [Marmoricola sp.]
MRPEQVLDCRQDLYSRLTEDRLFRNYVVGCMEEQPNHLSIAAGVAPPVGGVSREQSSALVEGLRRAVHRGEAYRVTHDMAMLVEHTAGGLDDTDLFSHDLAPSERGIVFFERPLPQRDVRGRLLLMHWLVWEPVMMGRERSTACFWFNDHLLGPDDIAKIIDPRAMKQIGRWGFIGCDTHSSGQAMGPPTITVDFETQAKILTAGDRPQPFTNAARYTHALWMLLGQSVTSVGSEYVPVRARKQATRAGLPARVSVVQLRRTEGGRAEGESLIQWSHRWLVRSHLRWQRYGPLSADHEHDWGKHEVHNGHSTRFCTVGGCENRVERIVIPPAIKGPENKPIRVTEHVYNMAR